ncbi:heavy metal-binding domain-containing protein [Hymenobacter rigui]|nr:heavy metal-binding domain-containing protein [Hymenobacter rigui]
MRTLWKRAALVVWLAPAMCLISCESKPATQEAAITTPAAAPADSAATPVVNAAYLCPMGCEGSASSKPGKCPVCGMDLEPNPAAKPAAQL